MRKEFEMTQAQMDAIMDAAKSVPYIIIGGMAPRSTQERANAAWARLGDELGFDYMTAAPVRGKSALFFTADEIYRPSESTDDLAQCTATVAECLADNRNTQTRQVYPLSILGDLDAMLDEVEAGARPMSDIEPSAYEIIDLYQREFYATQAQAIARLGSIDWAAVAQEVMA